MYKRSPVYYMFAPYGRVVITHVALIVGALPVIALGSPLPLLAILVFFKIVMDVGLHWFSHQQIQAESPAGIIHMLRNRRRPRR